MIPQAPSPLTMLKDAFDFPFRKGGFFTILGFTLLKWLLLWGPTPSYTSRLFSTEQALSPFGLLAMMVSLLITFVLSIRSATLTFAGGNHLTACPGGPYLRPILTPIILGICITLAGTLLVGLSGGKAGFLYVPLGILGAFYVNLALVAVIRFNSLRGLFPTEVAALVRMLPSHCLLLVVFDFITSTRDHRALDSRLLLFLLLLLQNFLLTVHGRFTGLIARAYRDQRNQAYGDADSSASAERI